MLIIENKKKEILLNMFYEVNITLINKCGKDIVRKKTQSFCEHRCETSEQNICKWNWAIYLKRCYITIKLLIFWKCKFSLILKISINVTHHINRIKEKNNVIISKDEGHAFPKI